MASTASSARCSPSRFQISALASGSSTIASTTNVASASTAGSRLTMTLPLTLAPEALADRADLGVGLVAGALGAREYGYVALGGGDGRQSACNGPGSRNCQTLRHDESFRLIDSPVNA